MFLKVNDAEYVNLDRVDRVVIGRGVEVFFDGTKHTGRILDIQTIEDFDRIRLVLESQVIRPDPTPVLPAAEEPTDTPNEALTKAAASYRGPGYATKSKSDHDEDPAETPLGCVERIAAAMADVDQTIDGLAKKYGRTWLEAALRILLMTDTGRLIKK